MKTANDLLNETGVSERRPAWAPTARRDKTWEEGYKDPKREKSPKSYLTTSNVDFSGVTMRSGSALSGRVATPRQT